MEKIQSLIRACGGRNSIFMRIFTGLILLSLIMVSFMGFWMNNVSSRNYRHQAALSNLNRLKQADEAMSLIVDVLNQSMSQMMWSNDFITYMVSPERVNPEQDYRMIRQLKSIISGSDLVQRAFLYSPFAEEIYDSTAIFSAKDFDDGPILKKYFEANSSTGRRGGTMTTTTVMTLGGRLLVLQDLNIASHIGILIYELNIQALSDTLGFKGDFGDTEVLIYDKEGKGVFDGLLSYETISPRWDDATAFIRFDNEEARSGKQTDGFYRYDSPENGWIYLIPLDKKELSLNVRDILPMYLLAAAVFLMLSIIFNFYVSSSIYRPINRLMKLVTQADGRQKPSEDAEIDFLEEAYSDAFGHQSRLNGLIADIAPEILDSMFKNLMVGKVLEEQRVIEILEGVGNPVEVHGRFLVLLCQMNEPKERNVTDTELNLHLLSIRNMVAGAGVSDYRIYDIHTEKMIVAIVMGFPSDYPVVSIKREYAKISQLLYKLGEKIPYRLQAERGSIYQNIMDIRYAYKEASDKLQYYQYLESSEETEGGIYESDTDHIVNRHYFKERTKLLAEQAGQGNKEGTESLLVQILDDLERNEPELEGFRSMAEVFLDELTEKVISLPLSGEDQKRLEAAHGIADLKGLNTKADLADQMLLYAQMAVELLHTYNKKNSYKYVKQAKEYISMHYADSSLSLNDVCEHIGISASYLSELFNEISGEKFSTYLAAFRVEKAGRLLRTTNVNIKEIGFRCGFNSIQNFIRVFKKYMDQTPGHYREEQS